ncbi:MAG TPA: flippase [Alphaproteobacteria bacterium]|nr:flippase [Alphaproteobacteria bacterium]
MFQKVRSIFLTNEIFQKSSVSLLLKIAGSLLGYVFLLLATRNIGASSWGVFVLFLSVLNISSIFSRLGVDILTLKLVSASSSIFDKIKSIYFSSVRLAVLASLIISVILYFTSDFIALELFHNKTLNYQIKLISYILPLFSIICINENVLRGLKMIKEFSFFQSTAKMLFSVVLFLLFFYGLGLNESEIVSQVFVYSIVIIFLLSTFLIFSIIKSGNFVRYINLKDMLSQSIPMMMSSSVLLLMSWTDSLMIGSFIGEYEVGVYNVAVKVALLTSFTLNAVNSISASKISESYNNNKMLEFKNIVNQTTKTIFYSTIPIIVIIFSFPDFILNFFGQDFIIAKSALLILAFSQVINAMSGSVGVILNMTGKEKVFRNILGVALLINISLNLLLIPKLGIEGAAIASASSLIFWNLYSVYYVYKHYGVSTLISFTNE